MEKPVVVQLVPYWEEIKEGRSYAWCACGRSKNQPFCDGSHKGTGLEPVVFDRSDGHHASHALLCGCRQTKNPPYCDGAHQALMQPDLDERELKFPTGHPLQDGLAASVEIGVATPDLPVKDCPASIRYYAEKLGFKKTFDDAALGFDHTMFAGMARGKLSVTLDEHADEVQKVTLGAPVDDVDALFEELRARGATIVQPPINRVWGMRELGVADLDGHRLNFAAPVTD